MADIQLSPVQLLAMEAFDDPTIVKILYGGGAGSGKSFLLALLAVLSCRKYPGIRNGLGRKELKRLKQTTVATLLYKVHPALGIRDDEFKVNWMDGVIEYKNTSQIIFIDMASKPSDVDFANFGSLELTNMFIDEAGELTKKAVDVISSRTNRWKNEEYGLVGKTVASCNPSQNFLRNDFYDPYKRLGGGQMQKWNIGSVWVNGEQLDSFQSYIRSTVLDNSFIDRNYIENLKNLPMQERKRLLDGDWNYADDEDSLFNSLILDKATAYDLPEQAEKFSKYIGVDVADKGKDQTIATLIDNGIIVTQKELKLSDEDKASEKPLSLLLADELIKFAQQNGFTASLARNIAVEGNGVGVGIRDALRIRGWYINVYEANARSRSDGYYQLMLDMDAGAIKILNGLDDGELRKQLAAHTYEMVDQKPKVIRKDLLKPILGRSPDNADSAMIGNWARNHQTKKNSSSRIRF